MVLTLTGRFRVQSELEAHQVPPAHDTRTRVATGFSTTGIRKHDINYNIDINREGRAYNATVLNTSSRELNSSYNMSSSGSIKGTEYGQDPNCPREGYT